VKKERQSMKEMKIKATNQLILTVLHRIHWETFEGKGENPDLLRMQGQVDPRTGWESRHGKPTTKRQFMILIELLDGRSRGGLTA